MQISEDGNTVLLEGNVENFALPTDVKDAINAVTPPPGEVFNVSASETFDGQVLRFERIQFTSGSILTLSHQHEFVAIVADELLFSAPLQTATIKLTDPPVLGGEDGKAGKPGGRGGRTGRGDHHGARGGRGGRGTDGTDGGEQTLPTIYILTNRVQAQNPPSGYPFFNFELRWSSRRRRRRWWPWGPRWTRWRWQARQRCDCWL